MCDLIAGFYLKMGDTGTKRRKWDVAAPAGVPAKSRAGVGNAGVTGINHPAYGGPAVDQLPTGISLSRATNNTSAPAAWFAPGSAASSVPKVVLGDARNKPLDDDAIRRIQQSALDVVAKLNQVGLPRLRQTAPSAVALRMLSLRVKNNF